MNKNLLGRINKLNKEQSEAVEHLNNPCLVIAGAGSGKTEVLSLRIAKLISEDRILPENILVVTFTNEAKDNMIKRLKPLVGEDNCKKLYIGTFHGICLKILRESGKINNPIIMSTWKQEQLMAQAMKNINCVKINKDEVLSWISIQKNSLRSWNCNFYDYYKEDEIPQLENYIALYREYETLKKKENLVDFGDMILKTYDLLLHDKEIRNKYAIKFQHICVDEAQDSSEALLDIIKILAEFHNNLFMVGDIRQSIYGFANAKLERLLSFEGDWKNSKVIYLKTNYRSTQSIVELGNRLTDYNNHKYMAGNAQSYREIGCKPKFKACIDEFAEADYIANEILKLKEKGVSYKNMAVLYRTNAQSAPFELVFRKYEIPFNVLTGNEFFERKEVQAVVAYMQLAVDTSDNMAFRQIYNLPYRGFNKEFLDTLNEFAYDRKLSLYEALPLCTAIRKNYRWEIESKELAKKIKYLSQIAILHRGDASRVAEEVIYSTGMYEYYKEKTGGEDSAIIDTLETFIQLGQRFKNVQKFINYCVKGILEAKSSTNRGDRVKLMTFHKSKGMEFKVTFCAGISQGLMPYKKNIEDEYLYNEERRICYVGITRAEDMLYVTYPMVYKNKDMALSDFMTEMVDEAQLSKIESDIYMNSIDLEKKKEVIIEPIAEQISLLF